MSKLQFFYKNGLGLLSEMRGRSTQASLSGGYFSKSDRLVWHSLNFLACHSPSEEVWPLLNQCKSRALMERLMRIGVQTEKSDEKMQEVDQLRQAIATAAYQSHQADVFNEAVEEQPGSDLQLLVSSYARLVDQQERAAGGRVLAEDQLEQPHQVAQSASFDLTLLKETLARLWGHDWLALDYLVTSDEITVFSLDPHGTTVYQWPKPGHFETLIHQIGIGENKAADYYLAKLGEILFPPEIAERLRDDLVVVIAPHTDALHNLPWGALKINGGFLIEQVQPLLIPSLSVIVPLWARHQETARDEVNAPTVFGTAVEHFVNPVARHPSLGHVLGEIEHISNLFGGAFTFLSGSDVTFGRLQQVAQESDLSAFDVWHIASHGVFNNRFEGRVCGFALYDSDIYTAEIGRLGRLPNTVFLSTCSGMPLKVFAGDEVGGLPPSLLTCGVQTVLGSIWPIVDEQALQISKVFYQRWADFPQESHLTRMTMVLRTFVDRPLSHWGGYRVLGLGK